MGWEHAKDFLLIAYSAYLALLYALREPFFLYPAVGLTMTVTWELLGWTGRPAALTLLAVLGAFLLAGFSRYLRHQPLLLRESSEPLKAANLSILGFAFSLFVIGIPLSLLLRP